jgi:hypothetical protein
MPLFYEGVGDVESDSLPFFSFRQLSIALLSPAKNQNMDRARRDPRTARRVDWEPMATGRGWCLGRRDEGKLRVSALAHTATPPRVLRCSQVQTLGRALA